MPIAPCIYLRYPTNPLIKLPSSRCCDDWKSIVCASVRGLHHTYKGPPQWPGDADDSDADSDTDSDGLRVDMPGEFWDAKRQLMFLLPKAVGPQRTCYKFELGSGVWDCVAHLPSGAPLEMSSSQLNIAGCVMPDDGRLCVVTMDDSIRQRRGVHIYDPVADSWDTATGGGAFGTALMNTLLPRMYYAVHGMCGLPGNRIAFLCDADAENGLEDGLHGHGAC